MAPRLTVIISQSATRDGRSVDTEESLVAHLMMTPGLDATLIGSLETMQVDSTDYLCLSSFQHNFALISWLDETAVNEHWKRLGLAGSIASRGSANGHLSKPRIYYLPLRQATGVAEIMQQLELLQNERSVQTVNIMLTSPSTRSAVVEDGPRRTAVTPEKVEVASNPMVIPPTPAVTKRSAPPDTAGRGGENPRVPPPAKSLPLHGGHGQTHFEDDDEEWEELDRLVDDLDAFKF